MTRHLNQQFFVNNRRKLVELLPANALIVMSAYSEMQRKNDASFFFEQEASFYYLTGIEAADWRLIIDKPSGQEWLVAPELDLVKQTFDGSLSPKAAIRTSGTKSVIDEKQMTTKLVEFKSSGRKVYSLDQPSHFKSAGFTLNPAQARLNRQLKRQFGSVADLAKYVLKLRAIKQPPEIAAIEDAIAATIPAFEIIKKQLVDYQFEYEVEADMTRSIRFSGARGHAYDPIVAGGKNACTLHYVANDQPLATNHLLLIDVGASSVDGYAADISRTYVAQPTYRQLEVHGTVVKAQAACIDLLKPGLKLMDYQASVDLIMQSAVASLGLDLSKYRDYFSHAIGHGLGLDVHDSLTGYDELKPGMVLTVEPGIYIKSEGLGVRIEDDILITETGYCNLSAGLSTAF